MIWKPKALLKWVFTTTPRQVIEQIWFRICSNFSISGIAFHSLSLFSGNIANYLNLMEVDSMYLPVPVNFIFIGFDGKGNQGISLILIILMSLVQPAPPPPFFFWFYLHLLLPFNNTYNSDQSCSCL